MRRILIFLLIAAVVIFAGINVCKKPKAARIDKKTSSKTAGKITPRSREEIAQEKRKRRQEERARQRELRKKLREQRRAQRLQGRYGAYYPYAKRRSDLRYGRRYGRISGAHTKKSAVGLYVLKAILIVDNEYVALVDNREVRVNDEIMGKKVLAIYQDRIVISDAGQTKEIRIGEAIVPLTTKSVKGK
jgi:hypothetical protein